MAAKIVQLIDQQVYQGQAMENVFNYVDVDGAADPMQLLSDYVAHVIPLVQQLQGTGLVHTNIRWRQVYPDATLMQDYAVGLPIAGLDPSSPAPSTAAYSFKWILGNPTVPLSGGFTGHIKRGGCRIGGVPSGFASGNTANPAAVVNGHAWAAELLDPGSDDWQLCVASFLIGNPVKPVPPARHGTPREHSDTVTSYTIVTGASDAAPSTQNTRKFLRGIAS